MSHVMRKPVFGFVTMSNTIQVVQPLKIARGLKFQIYDAQRLYYLCSENIGTDQLCDYRTADLHLCFCICKKQLFS